MSNELTKAIEEGIPGLKIDGDPTVSDALAIAQKLVEIAATAQGSVTIDGKVKFEEVAGVVKATIGLAPKSFWKAAFDEAEEHIKESKTKWDDVFLPVVNGLRPLFGAKKE